MHNGGDDLGAMNDEYLLDTAIAGTEDEKGRPVFFPSAPSEEGDADSAKEKLLAYLREIDR